MQQDLVSLCWVQFCYWKVLQHKCVFKNTPSLFTYNPCKLSYSVFVFRFYLILVITEKEYLFLILTAEELNDCPFFILIMFLD